MNASLWIPLNLKPSYHPIAHRDAGRSVRLPPLQRSSVHLFIRLNSHSLDSTQLPAGASSSKSNRWLQVKDQDDDEPVEDIEGTFDDISTTCTKVTVEPWSKFAPISRPILHLGSQTNTTAIRLPPTIGYDAFSKAFRMAWPNHQ